MEKPSALKLLLVLTAMAMVLYPKAEAASWVLLPPSPPIQPAPLCASQFALVNHACSILPFTLTPPLSPPNPTPAPDTPTPTPMSPTTPMPELLAPTPQPAPSGGHKHHHSHKLLETPIQENCCRWLKEVDNVCVCDLLVHLPPFLTRPLHNFTVIVDSSCAVTFSCGSRLVRD